MVGTVDTKVDMQASAAQWVENRPTGGWRALDRREVLAR